MAVQCIFLPAISLHCCFLHTDDLWDAEKEERSPDCSEWSPQTGSVMPFISFNLVVISFLLSSGFRISDIKLIWLQDKQLSILCGQHVATVITVSTCPYSPFLYSVCFCVRSAEGGGKNSLLPGSGLRSVLAPTPPQPDPEAHHLWWEGSKPLWTAQVGRKYVSHSALVVTQQ